jgi:hypothetical protein
VPPLGVSVTGVTSVTGVIRSRADFTIFTVYLSDLMGVGFADAILLDCPFDLMRVELGDVGGHRKQPLPRQISARLSATA